MVLQPDQKYAPLVPYDKPACCSRLPVRPPPKLSGGLAHAAKAKQTAQRSDVVVPVQIVSVPPVFDDQQIVIVATISSIRKENYRSGGLCVSNAFTVRKSNKIEKCFTDLQRLWLALWDMHNLFLGLGWFRLTFAFTGVHKTEQTLEWW